MPAPTAARVLSKFRKLHKRLNAQPKTLRFVLMVPAENATATDDFTAPDNEPSYMTPDAPAIVADQADEIVAQTLGGSLRSDQKLFTFLSDSLVSRTPTSTLADRVEAFLAARTGLERGGIEYGGKIYIISLAFPTPSVEGPIAVAGIIPQYTVLGTLKSSPAG